MKIAINEKEITMFVIKRIGGPLNDFQKLITLYPISPMARFCFDNIGAIDQDKTSQNKSVSLIVTHCQFKMALEVKRDAINDSRLK